MLQKGEGAIRNKKSHCIQVTGSMLNVNVN